MLRRLLNYCCRITTNFTLDKETKNNTNNIEVEQLIEWSHTIPFIPPITRGLVIKVYDGDTITIASKLPYENSSLYRFSVRLNGIDAPEIKGKTEDEIIAATTAKNALEKLILHKYVILKNTNTEKYGRILADVYLERADDRRKNCENLHINKWLLDNKLVVPYNGKTKHIPDSWLEYQSQPNPPNPKIKDHK